MGNINWVVPTFCVYAVIEVLLYMGVRVMCALVGVKRVCPECERNMYNYPTTPQLPKTNTIKHGLNYILL